MKKLRVTFSNGKRYDIPVSIIAEDRASYYAGRDCDGDTNSKHYNEIYKEELEYTLSSDYEIVDWAFNNMDWADIKDHAIPIFETKKVDCKAEWAAGELSPEIIK